MKKTILTLCFLISALLSFALGDLVITSASVTPNTNVNANGTVTLNYICKNAGDQPIGFNADFWISSNPTYESTDNYIGASTGATVLNPSATYGGYVNGISLAGKVTSGTWYIIIRLDPDNTYAEGTAGEANNISATSFVVGTVVVVRAKPDFIITKDSISTTTINAGKPFRVFTTIQNVGDTLAPSSSLSVYLSSSKNTRNLFLRSIATAPLAKNGIANYNDTFSVPFNYQSDSNQFIVIAVNSSNTIAELFNDSNNAAAIAVKFIKNYIPPPPCDCNLKMDGIFPKNIDKVYPGDTIPLRYFIRNNSDKNSTATKVHLYLSDDNILSNQDMMINTFDVPALPPNPSMYDETIIIPQNASTNTKYMFMKIDLVDSDTTDNIDNAYFDVNPIVTTGDLVVNSNTPSGTYQIVGYSNVISFGQQALGIDAGQQVLKFGKVTGYKTPANKTITIVANKLNTVEVTYEENTGINDNLTLNIINIYPNPSNGKLTINSNQDIAQISVYDITGKAVHNQEYTNKQNQTEIDLSALNNGIYFIAVQSANGEITKTKIVLAK
jgi:hypothetical protein